MTFIETVMFSIVSYGVVAWCTAWVWCAVKLVEEIINIFKDDETEELEEV